MVEEMLVETKASVRVEARLVAARVVVEQGSGSGEAPNWAVACNPNLGRWWSAAEMVTHNVSRGG